MFPFRSRWFRSFVRKRTGPIPHDVAQEWKTRLSRLYLVLAFNCSGLLIYYSMRDDLKLPLPSTVSDMSKYAQDNDTSVKIIKIRGLSLSESYVIDPDNVKNEENK